MLRQLHAEFTPAAVLREECTFCTCKNLRINKTTSCRSYQRFFFLVAVEAI